MISCALTDGLYNRNPAARLMRRDLRRHSVSALSALMIPFSFSWQGLLCVARLIRRRGMPGVGCGVGLELRRLWHIYCGTGPFGLVDRLHHGERVEDICAPDHRVATLAHGIGHILDLEKVAGARAPVRAG